MVKICSLVYPFENEETFKEYYEKFKYNLHDFQKWAIDGLVNGHHILVTAPTGTGKSMPAEFAIDFFHSKGKKSIYCSPIKSLSNQKFYDFTQKYPHISIGLITGDIKTNSNADVLIMTTEILLNKLYQLKSKFSKINSSTSFEMDIENELGCVIFDEIHMINDKDRGHVWENCIMMLPGHIQMIGLSATLDNPEKFAEWLETRGTKENISEKIVYLAKN
jgi:ATP-dependent RNA helicase HelY